jgi:hypothetical protein
MFDHYLNPETLPKTQTPGQFQEFHISRVVKAKEFQDLDVLLLGSNLGALKNCGQPYSEGGMLYE